MKTALVTGGTRGIGLAIANRLARESYHVVVTGTSAKTSSYEFLAVDFTDAQATEAFAKTISSRGIDVLINNAGINVVSSFEKIDLADFEKIQRVNVVAPMLLCRAVLPHMKRNRWGRILNLSSVYGKVSREGRGSYSASKFGLDGLTAALAAEVAAYGILANCVAPGFVDTELTRRVLGEKGMAEMAALVPMKRLAQPEEIAEYVGWLASEKNTYISGQNLLIDGGYTRV